MNTGRKPISKQAAFTWADPALLELRRQMRWAYLPPLMIYLADGISSTTGIGGTFSSRNLGQSAAFLASLGFGAGLLWALPSWLYLAVIRDLHFRHHW